MWSPRGQQQAEGRILLNEQVVSFPMGSAHLNTGDRCSEAEKMTRRCWNWPPEHIQIGWVSKFGRLLTIKNLPFAWQWACAIFWRARTALELACRQSNRALHSSTGAVQSREYSLLRRVFVGLDLSRSSASVETDENSPLRFWWKVSCRYSQHGGVLRRYHSAECHCARSCRGSHVMEAGGYRAPANPVFFF